jgi:hypothetical protein
MSEAAERAVERRRREDAAPRLIQEVPRLLSLSLEIDERRAGAASGICHTRRIVVANAPALFMLPCADSGCQDGGHDLTRIIMPRLRDGAVRFEGEHPCDGQVGPGRCPSVLHFVAVATYRPQD